jgi:diphosphomevalonate decarboxylase
MSQLTKLKFSAQAPSNIAFVKYWGKENIQEPINASLSMTLKNSKTITTWEISEHDGCELEIYLDDIKKDEFKSKILKWFDNLSDDFTFLKNSKSVIRTHNTFPHSTGIASSASAFASLAMCLTQIHSHVQGKELEAEQISELARLGSGSAARSIEGPFCEWGSQSKKYAQPLKNIHEEFMSLKDTICIVSHERKKVSSSLGHSLMNNHLFKEQRIKQASDNLNILRKALEDGNIESFGKVLEDEALSLHALMMTSDPSYILFEPETIMIINELRRFRKESNAQIYFTLDAGPNVHLIYQDKYKADLNKFISFIDEKIKFDIIQDEVGMGASVIDES